MSAFAFYRLPYKDHYTLVMQHDDDPEKLNSVNELNGKHGFVIAPFMPSEECPILLMRPDVVKHFPIQAVTTICQRERSIQERFRRFPSATDQGNIRQNRIGSLLTPEIT